MKHFAMILSAVLTMLAGSSKAFSQGHLITSWLGNSKCLDVVNDNSRTKVQMAPCGNYSGQTWTANDLGNGYFSLTSQFTGTGMCLDIVNDGFNNKLQLTPCGNYSGNIGSGVMPEMGIFI